MSFVVNAADKQRPLEIGETLCNLDFLDMQGKPFSLYAPTLFAWPKAILLADCVADVGPAISFFLEKFQTFNYTNTVLAVVTANCMLPLILPVLPNHEYFFLIRTCGSRKFLSGLIST
jgi:hypothetical protein